MTMENDYTGTLKRIKEIEEASSTELAQTKKSLEDEFRRLEEESTKSIEIAREQSEADVAKQVEEARSSAQSEADKMLASARKESEIIAARKLDRKDLKKIIDEIILAEFKES
jgi:vacuolar-type H+-ATPase subunit H